MLQRAGRNNISLAIVFGFASLLPNAFILLLAIAM